ncbi:MAG: DUF1553 domain-containing protein [Verrucomicrobiales bacterium]|nr:DUF1553 domain-containing protein [Verrucomicrobiales bacterium]
MKLSLTSLPLLLWTLQSAGMAENAGLDFFEKEIRPILVSECYQCHSAEEKIKGKLRLDWKGGWQKGGESGTAIIPGRVGKSLLIQAVRHSDSDLQMPPKKKLRTEQIQALEKWIAMGAPDPRLSAESSSEQKQLDLEAAKQFWAYRPVNNPTPPAVRDKNWPRTDIDRFILAAQEKKGIHPVRDSDATTLLRRFYFDLIGLPPPPGKVESFIKAAESGRQEALENLVDELLASPEFGVRWARHWLDIARFSQSTGGGRTLLFGDAWRYRDYVVEAFNSDKPYDQFIREQIAGDLLQEGSIEEKQAALIATAFLLLGPTNYELQDKTVLEMDIIDEQLDTMGKAFLGLTIGCARCHDHKFDPIRTEDYYGMAGILKGTKVVIHSNVSTWNKRTLPVSSEEEKIARENTGRINAIKKELATLKKNNAGKKKSSVPVSSLPGIVVDNLDAKLKGEWTQSTSNAGFVAQNYIHDGAKGKGEKEVAYKVKIPGDGKFEVRISYTEGTNRARKVPVIIRHADGEVTKYIDQTKTPPIDGSFISLGTYDFLVGEWEAVVISNKGTSQHVIADAIQFLPDGTNTVARKDLPDPAVKKDTNDTKNRIKKLEAELKSLQKNNSGSPKVIAAGEAEKTGDIHIAVRGNVHNVGKKTPRGFIQVLQQTPTPEFPAESSGRAELAEWIASPKNPLTARVFVNRVWHHLFGTGIVSSVDNFGHMGRMPTNPELIDHLASGFMANNWSIKKLIRAIMLSRVYQLSSEQGTLQAEVDLENLLHWRQNRRRLQAEAIRDSILSVSGSLDKKMGGPTVKAGTKTEYGYKFEGNRRSIYIPVFRNTLPEIMQVFDFADPNLVMGKRTTSSVPTQALFLMNNPFVRQQAKTAASRLLKDEPGNNEAKVNYAYQLTLGRSPSISETKAILDFLEPDEKPETAWTEVFQSLFASLNFRYLD